MKIRNGFVSNSSSSSFILVYDESKVLSNAEDIVRYVNECSNTFPLFRGIESYEGEDIFSLEGDQESLIRKFPDRFVKQNKNSNVKLYTECSRLIRDASEISYCKPDMSDVENNELSLEEYSIYMDAIVHDKEIPQELQDKVDKNNKYEEIYGKREQELIDRTNAQAISNITEFLINEFGCKKENIKSEKVYVDNSVTDDLITFAEKYLTDEYYTDSSNFVLSGNTGPNTPYLLEYEECITDKHEILEFLKDTNYILQPCFMFWSNPVFNYSSSACDSDDFYLTFFEIGTKEKDIIKEKLLESVHEVYFVTNAKLITNCTGVLEKKKQFMLGFGKPVVVEQGTDLLDFEDMF